MSATGTPPASALPRRRPAGLPRPGVEDVRAAYRLLLNREPEDAGVLERHAAKTASFEELAKRFLYSEEFAARNLRRPASHLSLAPNRIEVEVAASPAQLDAMLRRTGDYWARIGTEAPHWSVVTDDAYRPDRIAETREAFYASSEHERGLVIGLLERQRVRPADLRRCLEFGCGVGRVTMALAQLFPQVVGCDVSRPHLDLAQREAARLGCTNIAWHQSTPEGLMPRGQWDFWFSRLVLQHNPPPVIAHLLRLAFAGLAPGGIAIFQVPTHCNGYSFSVEGYLANTKAPGMEMHPLPQAHIFALAAEAGLQVLEVREHALARNDPAGWLSNLFVLRRPA
jgi:SAM-dependent methyltransferase